MSSFTVKRAGLGRDPALNALTLVLAERPDGSGHRLELGRAISESAEDLRAGLAGYSVGTESGAVHYNGIVHWSVDGTAVRLTLSDEAATVLGVGRSHVLRLATADMSPYDVGVALAMILAPLS